MLAGAVYGGYFGAGLGIMLLAILGAALPDDLQRINALKGLLSLIVSVVAAVAFALFGPVAWATAVGMGAASFAGGQAGVVLARRPSPPSCASAWWCGDRGGDPPAPGVRGRSSSMDRMRGGIDLGGTKIQAVVVDDDAPGRAARRAGRRPPRAARPTWPPRWPRRCARRPPRPRASSPRRSSGVGVGSPGEIDDAAGTVAQRAQPARLGGQPSRSRRELSEALGDAGRASATTCTSPPTPSSRSAPARPYRVAARRLLGHRRRRRDRPRRQAVAGPRRGRRDRPRRRRRSAARAARAGGAAAWRPTPGRAAMEAARAARRTRTARRPTSSRSWRSAAATG